MHEKCDTVTNYYMFGPFNYFMNAMVMIFHSCEFEHKGGRVQVIPKVKVLRVCT